MQNGGNISIYDVKKILIKKSVVDEESEGENENSSLSKQRRVGGRLYGICCKAGHNMRTYPEAEEIDSDSMLAYFN